MEQNEINFGRFHLDLKNRTLSSNGISIELKSKPFDILCVLALADGKLVAKDELMSKVWPGIVVDEGNIQVHISAIRKALGEERDRPIHLFTVSGRGYRWSARDRHLRQSPLNLAVLTQWDLRVVPRSQSCRSRT